MLGGMGVQRLENSRQRAVIAKAPQTRNHRLGDIGYVAVMTKRFAGVYVGDMDLDARDIDSGEGIAQRDTGMRERGRVDNNELGAVGLGLMHRFDQFLFAVALQAGEFCAGALRLGLQAMIDFIEGFRTIDFRLASAEQIQIWAVQYEDAAMGRST